MEISHHVFVFQVLELICTRESGAVFEAGGLNCVLSFIRDSGHLVHKDTLHSAMAVVSRLCSKMEPQDSSLETCVESLSSLLKHEDHQVTTTPTVCFSAAGFSVEVTTSRPPGVRRRSALLRLVGRQVHSPRRGPRPFSQTRPDGGAAVPHGSRRRRGVGPRLFL